MCIDSLQRWERKEWDKILCIYKVPVVVYINIWFKVYKDELGSGGNLIKSSPVRLLKTIFKYGRYGKNTVMTKEIR